MDAKKIAKFRLKRLYEEIDKQDELLVQLMSRAAGERAERRRRDPYLRRIYGISVSARGHEWRNRA